MLDETPKSKIPNPWTSLHTGVDIIIRKKALFKRSQHLLIAVSGGQDSLCLLKLLLDLQPKWDWHLGVAHCDHRWEYDVGIANRVADIAGNWQIPFYLKTAIEIKTSEGAARQWRYQALTEVAQEYGYECVVTAHTQSDRAETLLYNLARGTGTDGLQAITWKRPLATGVQLVRPLLEVSRPQTWQFCQDLHLAICEDIYNQDLKYARNRIRQELIPYLQTNFNPQVEPALAQTSELLRADVEYLEEQASKLLQEAMGTGDCPRTTNRGDRLNRAILRTAPLALQRRVMRQFLQQALPHAPNFPQIEKLVALITAPNRTQTDPFTGGAIAKVEGNWIILNHIARG